MYDSVFSRVSTKYSSSLATQWAAWHSTWWDLRRFCQYRKYYLSLAQNCCACRSQCGLTSLDSSRPSLYTAMSRHCHSDWARRSFAWRHDIVRPQSGEARRHCLFSVLLSAASLAEKSPTLTGCRVDDFVHAFVTSRVDYCNTVLVGAPKKVADKLQRVLNAAVRIVTGIRKFDRGLSRLLHAGWITYIVGCLGSGFVQACSGCPPMPPAQGTAVPA